MILQKDTIYCELKAFSLLLVPSSFFISFSPLFSFLFFTSAVSFQMEDPFVNFASVVQDFPYHNLPLVLQTRTP